MPFDADSIVVQEVLSMILKNPSSKTGDIIKGLYPSSESDTSRYVELWSAVQKVFENVLEISMEKGGPNLIHRLRFSWRILRAADKSVKRKAKAVKSDIVTIDEVRTVFDGLIPSKIINDCLLQELCSQLHVGSKGGFLKHYYTFLASQRQNKLGFSLIDSNSQIISSNVKRIIWWIIRKDRYKYVEPRPEVGIKIYTEYLTPTIREELNKWCDPREVDAVPNLDEIIGDQVDNWLRYSCLYGDNFPDSADEASEIIKAFISENELKHKIKTVGKDKASSPEIKKRFAALNAEIARYAEENRALEEENTALKKQIGTLQINVSVGQEKRETIESEFGNGTSVDSIREIQDLLKRVDSKYSLDVLRSAQLGEDYSITIKNFISHFFYCLRKKGLSNYPDQEEFELDYKKAGLYDCVGFSLSPGDNRRVRVEKQGWAFHRQGRIFPVKKAVVRLAS